MNAKEKNKRRQLRIEQKEMYTALSSIKKKAGFQAKKMIQISDEFENIQQISNAKQLVKDLEKALKSLSKAIVD